MNSLTKKRVVPTHFGRLYSDGAYGDAGNWVRRAEVDALLDEIERLTTALDAAKKVIADLRDEDGRLREELRGIMLAAHDNPTRMRQMACEALGQPAEPTPPLHPRRPQAGPFNKACGAYHPWGQARCELIAGHLGGHEANVNSTSPIQWPAESR